MKICVEKEKFKTFEFEIKILLRFERRYFSRSVFIFNMITQKIDFNLDNPRFWHLLKGVGAIGN